MIGPTHTEAGDQAAVEGFVLRSGWRATVRPEASIIIATRNRAGEVGRAVGSALDQGPTFETIVIDDCSDDHTVDVIAREFPAVRLYEAERPRGYIECRNFAASVARGPIIISIDDDACFQGSQIARETVADFDSHLVGAVSIPVVDGDEEEPADIARPKSRLAVPCFRGTAYAVRSDVFLGLGGFRTLFFHQAEERDFALRLLAAGYAIRAGTARQSIRHRPSPSRDLHRLHVFSQRNVILHGALNLPARQLPAYWAGMSAKGLLLGLRIRRLGRMIRGLAIGFAHSVRYRHLRRPVSNDAYRLGRRLYVRKAIPLSDIELQLVRFRELSAAERPRKASPTTSTRAFRIRRSNQPYDRRFLVDTARKARAGGGRILPYVCELVAPRSIVDVGCGTGAWLAVATEFGVTDVLGLDGDYVPQDLCEVPPGRFRKCDLSRGFSVERRFDLGIALEVAEHLPETSASRFVQALVDASPVVLFSAAIPGQPGTGHLNLQWPEYWAALFANAGYVGIDCIRPRFWADEAIPYFYRQNAVLYADRDALRALPRLRAERARTGDRILPLVHPVLHERDPSLRESARAIGPATRLAISRRLRSRLGRREQSWTRAS